MARVLAERGLALDGSRRDRGRSSVVDGTKTSDELDSVDLKVEGNRQKRVRSVHARKRGSKREGRRRERATNLDHDRQNRNVEREQEAAIGDDDESCELAELGHSSNSTERSNQQHDDLQREIPHDGRSDSFDGVDNDLTRWNRRSPLNSDLLCWFMSELVRRSRFDDGFPPEDDWSDLWGGEDGFGEGEGFVETDGDDEEGESLGETDGVDWDFEDRGGEEGGEEGEAGGDEDHGGEPEV